MPMQFPFVSLNTTEQNAPRWPGYCADPFILHHNGLYYAYGTAAVPEEPSRNGGHFVLLRSQNLIDWESHPAPLIPPAAQQHLAHWAPEVAQNEGQFWMFYSAAQKPGDDTEHRLRVAHADHPTGPFHDTGHLLLPDEGFTIDASPFRDPADGQWYLFFSRDTFGQRPGTSIAVAPLANDMQRILAPPRDAILPSADWHISRRNRHIYGREFPIWHTVEGAQVLYRHGRYYCFYSGGNWQDSTYGISCAVAPHPLGPWDDNASQEGPTVLLTQPNTNRNTEASAETSTTLAPTRSLIGPGHNSILTPPDSSADLCVYHAWDPTLTLRQLYISPLRWHSISKG